ncbi:hypothetical protein CIL05_10125 [Virgibacillus profundi]|uniref:NRDE family protein n=1 Tax=Virgibacillus profundi TaxID=2024555 RepID=A0A2A2IEC6_9BACI|nr:NRDE family protein [Virgibacillus profundi]PAV29718.1 hypothetical protein CIL05_10125 [Virgibacillus profundi]PXY53889.1 hypothetical protein CIT14_10225 [Virgibacillus profundi]
MCLINFQFQEHPKYKLIVAANRDEAYDRPTAPAAFWEDHPNILAGRDLSQMGTWLGITKHGRFAALTNYRDPEHMKSGANSRGEIITNYLANDISTEAFLDSLKLGKDNYVGFNLILGSPDSLYYYNNIENEAIKITSGTHGLSNHFLNTPWPKVTKGKKRLREYVGSQKNIESNVLFDILSDAEDAEDAHLPQTGVGLDLERILSPLFIKTTNYGTRSSTVLIIDHDNNVTFTERTYNEGKFINEKQFSFRLE